MKKSNKKKKGQKAAPSRAAPTIKQMLAAVEGITANLPAQVGAYDAFSERLLGVEQALRFALGDDNYIEHWLGSCAQEIFSVHKQRTAPGCTCAACKYARANDVVGL